MFIYRRVPLVLLVALLLWERGEAGALTSCSGTGINVYSNLTLTDDYLAANGTTQCFYVHNGADIDLNGHSITCGASCGNAINATAAGTRVVDSSGGGEISGAFSTAIFGAQSVIGIKFSVTGSAIRIGSTGLDRAYGNVIVDGGCGFPSIGVHLPSLGQIYNNYIKMAPACGNNIGIQVYSGDGAVHHNYVENYGFAGILVHVGSAQPWLFKNIIGPKNPGYTLPDSRPIQNTNLGLPPGLAGQDNICADSVACPVPASPWSMQ